ncbi:beta/gamma crystallin family protein [Paenibacillus sp. P26]|nr:beta/gamma crystallin family protein [Paenibacillus sp. P26]UUZ92752.1 beta/gamma crystallin family protein [Paenibacillus sp. P25]
MLLKRAKVLMLAALSIVALQVLPAGRVEAAGGYACDGSPGVYIYQDGHYSGACTRVAVGDYADLTSLGIPNDSASSVRIINNPNSGVYYEATLYDNSNYQGANSIIRFGSDELGQDAIGNDRLSSLKVRTISYTEYTGVYLFEHDYYHGDWVKITANTGDLGNFNDKASSVLISRTAFNGSEYKVALYENPGLSGRSTPIFSGDTPSLTASFQQYGKNGFNDITSSVLVIRN